MSVTSPVTGRVTGIVASGVTRAIGHRTRVADADVLAYIAAVEAADGDELEVSIKVAYETFIKDCKADGIWDAIKASCIIAGARTLAGCLVPLVGPAPTNVGPFVTGDYNRVTGLKGNGSTKYLNTNRKPSDQPQNSQHFSVYTTSLSDEAGARTMIGATATSPDTFSQILNNGGPVSFANNANAGTAGPTGSASTLTGLFASNRAASSGCNHRYPGGTLTDTRVSTVPNSYDFYVFARNLNGDAGLLTDRRKSFYSIGESLNLENLDTRVTALMTAIGAALA